MPSRANVSTGSPYEPVIGFSRAVRVGNVIAVSGTAPVSPEGKTVGVGDIEAQARRCFQIMLDAIEQLGASRENVIRTRMFLVNADNWEQVAKVHGEVFHDVRPASTFVVVSRFLDPDWLVETEMDAVLLPSVIG